MIKSRQYAYALYELIDVSPQKAALYIKNLKEVLERRGHIKLLPQIFSETQKLELKDQRGRVKKAASKEHERTRVLLELYRKLITS